MAIGEFISNNPFLTVKEREEEKRAIPSLRKAVRTPFFVLPSPWTNEKASRACFMSGAYRRSLGLQFKGSKIPKHPRKIWPPLPPTIYCHAFLHSTTVKIVLYDFWKQWSVLCATLRSSFSTEGSSTRTMTTYVSNKFCCISFWKQNFLHNRSTKSFVNLQRLQSFSRHDIHLSDLKRV